MSYVQKTEAVYHVVQHPQMVLLSENGAWCQCEAANNGNTG